MHFKTKPLQTSSKGTSSYLIPLCTNTYIYYTLPLGEKDLWSFKGIPVISSNENRGYVQVKLLQPIPDEAKIVLKGAYYLGTMMGGEE